MVSVAVLLLLPLGAFALTPAELNYVVNLQLHDLQFFHKTDEQQLVQSEMARHKQFFATHHSKAARKLFQQGILQEQQRFNQHSAAQDQLVFQTIAFEQSTHTISPYTLTFFTP
jgi:type III secretory pathway component EscR